MHDRPTREDVLDQHAKLVLYPEHTDRLDARVDTVHGKALWTTTEQAGTGFHLSARERRLRMP